MATIDPNHIHFPTTAASQFLLRLEMRLQTQSGRIFGQCNLIFCASLNWTVSCWDNLLHLCFSSGRF